MVPRCVTVFSLPPLEGYNVLANGTLAVDHVNTHP